MAFDPAGLDVAAQKLDEAIRSAGNAEIIGWAHDRMDPDVMGAAGLLGFILSAKYGKKFSCYYSKRMSFAMNRSLANSFLPPTLLRRCEEEKNMRAVAEGAGLIMVLDATNIEIMSDLATLARRSPRVRDQRFFFIDHHRAGESDIEAFPNASGLRLEDLQSTSAILVQILRRLGLALDPSDEEQFRIAVAAKAGIDIDLIGIDKGGVSPTAREAIEYLESIIGERGQTLIERLQAIKHPLSWYRTLGQALSAVPHFDPNVAICGLGVVDDTGVIPFVANELMSVGQFRTVIVFAIVYDRFEERIVAIDLDASGRTRQDTEIVLPDIFRSVFYITTEDGRKVPMGGGRTNLLMGDFSGAGASVPLAYWEDVPASSADEKVSILEKLAWPTELQRNRSLLASKMSVKPEKVVSVVPTVEI